MDTVESRMLLRDNSYNTEMVAVKNPFFGHIGHSRDQ
jgi:hypothetical protein